MNSKFVNNFKTALFLGLLTGLILLAGDLIAGQRGLIFAVFIAAAMNMTGYFFSDKIALASAAARRKSAPTAICSRSSTNSLNGQASPCRAYISPEMAPNAFATGRNPQHAAVCATQGLLQMLDRNEIAGVMGHELSHVKHRDILIQSVAATIAGAISVLGYMFMWGGGRRSSNDSEGGAIAGLLVLILGPLAAGLIQAAISRSREFNADTSGATMCGNPMWLATALEKIHMANQRIPMDVNPAFNSMYIAEPLNAVGSVKGLFQTHPPLEARLMNLIGRESTGMFRRAA